MCDDTIHRQEYGIRDLSTKSVILYPTRAQIIRDIDNITLKPGNNEVVILGLTPTAEESSIKVDGKGAATVVDMTVTLVDNKEKYEDLYPPEPEDSESEEEESDDEVETEGSKKINTEIEGIKSQVEDALEGQNAATEMLEMLKQFGFRVRDEDTAPIDDHMDAYAAERQKAYELHKSSAKKLDTLRKELAEKEKQLQKELKPALKEKDKISKAKFEQKLEKDRLKAEKAKAKEDLKKERTQFWPKQVYKVTISLDASPEMTPLSSRRGSMDTLVIPAKQPEQSSSKIGSSTDVTSSGLGEISLSISYITQNASWSPHYDLSLNTMKSNGSIVYRAEFVNKTSETWKDAAITLSTIQTTFQGLGEKIPEMEPWPIRLQKGAIGGTDSSILYSKREIEYRQSHSLKDKIQKQSLQKGLFGFKEQTDALKPAWSAPSKKAKARISRSIAAAAPPPPAPAGAGLFGMSRAFSSAKPDARYRSAVASNMQEESKEAEVDYSDEDMGFGLFDDDLQYDPTIEASEQRLAHQESTWEEAGLTASYDIPSKRTIAPSTIPRRHKIATITLKDINLSYVLVPKLRSAAFLKAKLRNNSNITLLKGLAGLTLDGSFLGNTELQRCSAGETFPLSLGVDPAVHVAYSKPTVRRAQTGVFSKEGSCVFTRVCTLTNTKSNIPIEGLVQDQVPVSEDERLRVDLLQPKGLKSEGDRVKAGTAAETINGISRGRVESTSGVQGVMGRDEKWGKAIATFKKGGEVSWDVKVMPGQGVRLVLEYETRFPGSEGVVSV